MSQFQIGSEGRAQSKLQKLRRLASDPFRLWGVLSDKRIDLVHINSSLDHKAYWRDIVFLFIAKLARVEIIFQLHGGQSPEEFSRGSGVLSRLMGRIFSLADYFVVLTSRELKNYARLISPGKLYQIPNCIDQTISKHLPSKSFSPGLIHFAYIGRLVSTKGIFEIADGLKLAKQAGLTGFELHVAGDGPDKNTWLSYVSDCGLASELVYHGSVSGDQKNGFWQKAEVLLLPSYSEGLPYSVLEALAFGVPVVATDVGGIPDAIEHGVHGLIIEPRNAEALASAISELAGNIEQLDTMSTACRSRAEEEYSISTLVNSFSPMYLGARK